MATKNPRVVGYISPEDHSKLREFQKRNNLTESKAIALIVQQFFSGGEIPSVLSPTTSTPNPETLERIATLERQMAEMAELRSALGELLA